MANYHRNELSGPQAVPTVGTVTFSSLRDDLAALRAAAPAGIVDPAVISIGSSEQGKPIHAIRIGKNPAIPVLIAGCHHAREWISVEIPFLIAKELVEKYSQDINIQRIVDSRDIWIVPMVNPDGHEHTVLKVRLWRKNFPTASGRKSVDPNRNYNTSTWNASQGAFSDDPTDDSYRGPTGGYAAEVTAMQTLITAQQFKGSLDFHSFGRFVLFPWSGNVAPHPDALQDGMAGKVERIIDLKGKDYTKLQASQLYTLSPWSQPPEDAKVPGGLMDFVVENVPDSIAVTVELEPEHTDPRGFILPDTEIEPTFKLHRGAILTFLNCIGSIRTPPTPNPLVLQPGVNNDLTIFQTDCTKAFETY